MKQVNLKLPEETISEIKDLANSVDTSMGRLLELWVGQGLESYKKLKEEALEEIGIDPDNPALDDMGRKYLKGDLFLLLAAIRSADFSLEERKAEYKLFKEKTERLYMSKE